MTGIVVDYQVKIQPVSEFIVYPATIHEFETLTSFYPENQKLIWPGNISLAAASWQSLSGTLTIPVLVTAIR